MAFQLYNHRRDPRSSTLLAGPFLGEFGWELFCWQGRLRRLAKQYQHTYVLCRQGHETLYSDFATVNQYPSGESEGYRCHGIDVIPANTCLAYYDWKWRGNTARLQQANFLEQDFVRLGAGDCPRQFDVLIHARARSWRSRHNWPAQHWHQYVRRLVADGLTVGHIGRTGSAEDLTDAGSTSVMDIPLAQLAVQLRSGTRLLVGTSSGPMHLASLCGCPHLVLSDDRNYQRYQTDWNPFDTRVYFSNGGWQPTVDLLYNETIAALDILRQPVAVR